MRNTQAARYARGSAILALLLASFVGGTYIRRAWRVHKARKSEPSAVPAAVEQQAAEFSFSKETGDHPEFTIRASHATEFAEGGRALLQDVWVTFYGQDGSRADNLHTRSCELLNSAGNILCAGNVRIDLQSADDARLFPGTPDHPNPRAHIMHITTSHVSFDRNTGITASDQPVTFQFPQGQGRAVGLSYDSHQEELRLLHAVDLDFQKPADPHAVPLSLAAATDAGQPPLHVTAASLEYRRDQRVINLQGPVVAQQGVRRLAAGHLAVELDPMLRVHRLVVTAKPVLTTLERPGDNVSISAKQFLVLLSPQGWIERMSAVGSVHADDRSGLRDDRLNAARVDLEMADGSNQPRSLTASQNVVAQSDGPGGLSRRLATSRLDVQFVLADPSAQPHGQTPGAPADGSQLQIAAASTPAATLDWHVPADHVAKTPADQMHLSSERLEATFGPGSEVREVHGSGGVKIARQIGTSDPQVSSSRELVARLASTGDWSSLDLTGDVNLRQTDQAARADQAHFDRQTDKATLNGSIALSNPRYRLTAHSATFDQQTNEFQAAGDVVSSEISTPSDANGKRDDGPNAGIANLAPGPASISADHLILNTATGHAVYSDHARLWQGNSLIEADRLELDRTAQSLTANGHVRAVFPQAPLTSLGDLAPKPHVTATTKPKISLKAEFVRTEAGRLVYRSLEDRAVLDQGVTSQFAEGSIQSDAMNLYFSSVPKSGGGAAETAEITKKNAKASVADPPSEPATGPLQLIRATALGHVVVLEGDRRATASQADYAYADGKFVLSGGAPTVRDSSGNSASGRELTLFFADDRIVIDSAEGSRTLTLHRVEK